MGNQKSKPQKNVGGFTLGGMPMDFNGGRMLEPYMMNTPQVTYPGQAMMPAATHYTYPTLAMPQPSAPPMMSYASAAPQPPAPTMMYYGPQGTMTLPRHTHRRGSNPMMLP